MTDYQFINCIPIYFSPLFRKINPHTGWWIPPYTGKFIHGLAGDKWPECYWRYPEQNCTDDGGTYFYNSMQIEIDEDGCSCTCKRSNVSRANECKYACGEGIHYRDYLGVVNVRMWCNEGKQNFWWADGQACGMDSFYLYGEEWRIRHGYPGNLWYYKINNVIIIRLPKIYFICAMY